MTATSSPDSSPEGGARDAVWLGAILLLALAVRLWAIDFGLPNEHARPDERHLIGYTLTIGGNHLNPGFFNYPSLYLYVLFAVYVGYFCLGLVTGRFHSAQDLARLYAIEPVPLYLIDRVLVALLGTATVAVVYWIGKRLAGRRVGLLAALFLSVAYLHVRDSHFGTVDVPVGFVATLAVAFILRAHDARSLRSFVVAGFVSGLAVSTKYNAIALVVPLGVLFALEVERSRSKGLGALLPLLLASVAALLIGFVVGTPFAVLDWTKFVRDAGSEIVGKMGYRPRPDLGPGWLYHLRVTLWFGLGLPMLLFAAYGALASLRENLRLGLLALAFPAAWFVGIGMSRVGYLRYCVPLVPMLCVFAAWGVHRSARWFEAAVRRHELEDEARPESVVVLVAFAAGALAIPALMTVEWNRLACRTDTRVLAREWVERHVPAGESIGLVGSPYMRPEFWNTVEQMRQSSEGETHRGRGLRNELRLEHVERAKPPVYELYAFDRGAWRDTLNPTRSAAELPRYVIFPEHPLLVTLGTELPKLDSSYTTKARFDGYDPVRASAIYDWWDALFLPYAKFDGLVRPGPNFRVLERTR